MSGKDKAQKSRKDAQPLYRRVKDHIARQVLEGHWPVGSRIPSENALTAQFAVSRMTVNRALRELTDEELLHRVKGAGTYVAEPKPQSALLEIRNIREEILERGHEHSCEVIVLEASIASRKMAGILEVREGSTLFHSLILHLEDGLAVELEERYVNPAFAPNYLQQDFVATTTFEYLDALGPMNRAERSVDAVLPDRQQQKLLQIGPNEPCLLVSRRTFSGKIVAARTRSLLPGSRYRLFGIQHYD